MITIFGHGFVGKAVEYGFGKHVKQIFDPIYAKKRSNKYVAKGRVDFWSTRAIFICVPTPMLKDGSVDGSIVESVVDKIIDDYDQHLQESRYSQTNDDADHLIVLKSTLTPDLVNALQDRFDNYGHLKFVYNPEFLTERSAMTDFVNPPMHVFGGYPVATSMCVRVYDELSICASCPVHQVTASEASFIKYGINSYLASKIIWFNQFKDVVEGFDGAAYNKISRVMGGDDRIGASHIFVPGPDFKNGYGGACFPKDVNALIKFGKFPLLESVSKINNKIRSKYELGAREKEQGVKFNV